MASILRMEVVKEFVAAGIKRTNVHGDLLAGSDRLLAMQFDALKFGHRGILIAHDQLYFVFAGMEISLGVNFPSLIVMTVLPSSARAAAARQSANAVAQARRGFISIPPNANGSHLRHSGKSAVDGQFQIFFLMNGLVSRDRYGPLCCRWHGHRTGDAHPHTSRQKRVVLKIHHLPVAVGGDAHVADQHVRKTPFVWFPHSEPIRHSDRAPRFQTDLLADRENPGAGLGMRIATDRVAVRA